jgi:hypothetical protein
MICKTRGCEMKHFALGFCRKHHARFKRNGTDVSLYDMESNKDEAPLDITKDVGKGRRGFLYINIINDIKYKALQRGKSWELSHKDAFALIRNECLYCGFTPDWPANRVGIDRVDNLIGYTIDNCVSCCFTCNSAKGDKSLEQFINWIKRVHSRIV